MRANKGLVVDSIKRKINKTLNYNNSGKCLSSRMNLINVNCKVNVYNLHFKFLYNIASRQDRTQRTVLKGTQMLIFIVLLVYRQNIIICKKADDY